MSVNSSARFDVSFSDESLGIEGATGQMIEREEIAQKETRAVFRLRFLVIAILCVAASTISVVLHFTTKAALEKEFAFHFADSADKVLMSFEQVMIQKVNAFDGLGVTFTAYALERNESWPFVTMNSFQHRAATTRSISSTLFVAILPLIEERSLVSYDAYTSSHLKWIEDGLEYQSELGLDRYIQNTEMQGERPITIGTIEYGVSTSLHNTGIIPGDRLNTMSSALYTSVWQSSPVLPSQTVYGNILYNALNTGVLQECIKSGHVVVDRIVAPSLTDSKSDFFSTLLSIDAREESEYNGDPMTSVFFPVYDNFSENRTVVALLTTVINWAQQFENVLPASGCGVTVVLDSGCGEVFTYKVSGSSVVAQGRGDLHDPRYDSLVRATSFKSDDGEIQNKPELGIQLNQNGCAYNIRAYPSSSEYFESKISTARPILTFAIVSMFFLTIVMFVVYDRLVERRQKLVLRSAMRSNALLSSLFPDNVRNRLMANGDIHNDFKSANGRVRTYLDDNHDSSDTDQDGDDESPIADLFPYTTVMFADISGFTAWSSERDPAQVFILLQKLYQAFDCIARQCQVFKVETIGDSYVAVAGIPNPQDDHAVKMVRYCSACNIKMGEVVRSLEVKLGPETGDLLMRFGLHSGPVTAGVLQGDRSRFQLFGDTVNTAARMESTGSPGRTHISQATADLLLIAGKGHWIVDRSSDAVHVKGKGVLKTFWAFPVSRAHSELGRRDTSDPVNDMLMDHAVTAKSFRLVDWIVELLIGHLKQVAAKGCVSGKYDKIEIYRPDKISTRTFVDEVSEALVLPKFDQKLAAKRKHKSCVKIPSVVVSQLHRYVMTIASKYHANSFHNWEHACHVTMAVDKFLKRIVSPDLHYERRNSGSMRSDLASQLHDYTHGITSDPLALLSMVFSALIHDVDHRGVSNQQLAKEEEAMSRRYEGKSIAEQNSLDIAWELLQSDEFCALRECMFSTQAEMNRFRQLIVNVVLATDIFDKDLNALRKQRWKKAFGETECEPDNVNDLRATVVIEYIIQASDVSHTMQHWHVYRKWNRRLFLEMSLAFKEGRMASNPASFWYKGELGFFDNYIIPLAKNLKECNVFGVSSDECLNYALLNRAEWKDRGEEIVEEMKRELAAMGHSNPKGTFGNDDSDEKNAVSSMM